jgi:hypothetical protein
MSAFVDIKFRDWLFDEGDVFLALAVQPFTGGKTTLNLLKGVRRRVSGQALPSPRKDWLKSYVGFPATTTSCRRGR